jgi:hypothetical protein
VTSTGRLFLTDGEDQGTVHFNCCVRGATRGCSSQNRETAPLEMASPTLTTWTKKGRTSAGQRGGGGTPHSFTQGTRGADYREILHHRRAACCSQHDVIDVEGGLLSLLRQAAVFAIPAGPILDQRRSRMGTSLMLGPPQTRKPARRGVGAATTVRPGSPDLRPPAVPPS